jgi:hypothetical protein
MEKPTMAKLEMVTMNKINTVKLTMNKVNIYG